MGGQTQSVNEKDVEQVKTGHGMTKFLIQHKRSEGPNIMIRYWGRKHLYRYTATL
jgi:hypothetical protein